MSLVILALGLLGADDPIPTDADKFWPSLSIGDLTTTVRVGRAGLASRGEVFVWAADAKRMHQDLRSNEKTLREVFVWAADAKRMHQDLRSNEKTLRDVAHPLRGVRPPPRQVSSWKDLSFRAILPHPA